MAPKVGRVAAPKVARVAAPKAGRVVAAPKAGRVVAAPKAGRVVAAPKAGRVVAAPKAGRVVAAPKAGRVAPKLNRAGSIEPRPVPRRPLAAAPNIPEPAPRRNRPPGAMIVEPSRRAVPGDGVGAPALAPCPAPAPAAAAAPAAPRRIRPPGAMPLGPSVRAVAGDGGADENRNLPPPPGHFGIPPPQIRVNGPAAPAAPRQGTAPYQGGVRRLRSPQVLRRAVQPAGGMPAELQGMFGAMNMLQQNAGRLQAGAAHQSRQGARGGSCEVMGQRR